MSRLLWSPSEERVKSTNMFDFIQYVNRTKGKSFSTYGELYEWSISDIPGFWSAMWSYGGVIHSEPFTRVVDDWTKMPGAKWFEGARLNFARNLLRYRDDRIALSFRGEGAPVVSVTYAELYDRVARLARPLKEMGIKPGDRVAGFMPNMIEAVVGMLAATSLGAVWSSCSPDFGIQGVLDRFGQIQPRVLMTADGYRYNGKPIDSLERVAEVVKRIPTIEQVLVVPYLDAAPDVSRVDRAVLFNDFLAGESGLEIPFEDTP
ncbi:MAG: AMP-binding protein, partial [Acidobacteriota bacterium]